MKIKEICEYGKKSKIKAGKGLSEGNVKFFTSSSESNKFVKEEQFTNPGIIMGTGGNATLHYCDEPFSVSTDCIVLFPKIKVSPKYLYYFFKGNFHVLQSGFKGAGLKHTSKKYIDEISLNHIPSNDEQVQIVNILDNVNDIIVKKNQQLQEYDQLIKSRFVEMFGDPILNQKGWNSEKLQSVCPVNKYKGEVENISGKVWLLNLDMIESNTGKIIDYVYEDENIIASSTIKFDTNCVLYSKLRPYLNKVVVPSKSGYATSEMISMKTDNINKYFLSNLLMMNSFVDFANGTSYGAKMPRASVDMIKNFDLMLPPKSLQDDFGLFVEQVDKLKFVIQKSLDETQTLFDSLMQQYFG